MWDIKGWDRKKWNRKKTEQKIYISMEIPIFYTIFVFLCQKCLRLCEKNQIYARICIFAIYNLRKLQKHLNNGSTNFQINLEWSTVNHHEFWVVKYKQRLNY